MKRTRRRSRRRKRRKSRKRRRRTRRKRRRRTRRRRNRRGGQPVGKILSKKEIDQLERTRRLMKEIAPHLLIPCRSCEKQNFFETKEVLGIWRCGNCKALNGTRAKYQDPDIANDSGGGGNPDAWEMFPPAHDIPIPPPRKKKRDKAKKVVGRVFSAFGRGLASVASGVGAAVGAPSAALKKSRADAQQKRRLKDAEDAERRWEEDQAAAEEDTWEHGGYGNTSFRSTASDVFIG